MKRILVDQANITGTATDEAEARTLAPGEARLALESFALTANNVTYAAAGFMIGYWKFFPSGIAGQGIVPVWGVARVVESRSDAVAPGVRLYGFFPMAEGLVIVPEKETGATGVFTDRSDHRAGLPAVYNTYVTLHDSTPRKDHLRALLQPLLATSYLLYDWLEDNAWFGATQIVIGSASSKTGLGLIKFLAEREERPYRIVGLTSQANREFVEALGACDSVLSYDEVERLERQPSVYVDMAGHAGVKAKLHRHLGDRLCHSAAVGTSHWDKFAPPGDLPGPKPQFFFAPAHVAKRREEWGPGVIERRIAAAWKRIAAEAGDWMEVVEHQGLEAAEEVYRDLAQGRAAPGHGHVIVL